MGYNNRAYNEIMELLTSAKPAGLDITKNAPKTIGRDFAAPTWLNVPKDTPRTSSGFPLFNSENISIPDKAKNLGFNKLLFHSTDSEKPFDAFKMGHSYGIHTGTINAALQRGQSLGSEGIIPVLMKTGNEFRVPDFDWESHNLANLLKNGRGNVSDLDKALGGDNPNMLDARNFNIEGFEPQLEKILNRSSPDYKKNYDLISHLLNKNDVNTLSYINKNEHPGSISYAGTQPSQFRVPWADFDPTKINSGNIYAGLAGAGLLGAGISSNTNRNE